MSYFGNTQPNAPQGPLGIVGTAANAVPVAGAIVGAIRGLVSIVSLFTGHGAAVKNEADMLNAAVPTYSANLQAIMAALEHGDINEEQAKQAIDNAVADYYSGVTGNGRGSIRGKGTINASTCSPGPKVDPCNAACVIGYQWIEPWACNAKALIDRGGSYIGNPIPSNGAIMGQPGIQLQYNKPVLGISGATQKHALIGVAAAAVVGVGAFVFMRH